VHGHHPPTRQDVVERGENGLLHLTGVSGPSDDNDFLGEVDDDERAGAGSVPFRVSLKIRSMQNGEPGTKLGQLGRQSADEHVSDEQRMPCVRRDEPDRQPVRRIRTGEEILHEDFPRIEVAANVFLQPLERFRLQPGILFPPDTVAGPRLLYQELVLGGAAGMGSGDRRECATIGQHTLASAYGVLQKLGRREVRVDANGKEAVLDKREVFARGSGGFGCHGSNLDSPGTLCNLIAARSKVWARYGTRARRWSDPGG
jgi:hypothetical protein